VSTPNISLIFDFREKWFRHVLYGFEGAIRWYYWFDLKELFEGHMKITFNFLNGTYYLSLHILVAYLESFPKHYN